MSLREAFSRDFERCECARHQIRFAAEAYPTNLKPNGRWPDLRTQCLWALIDHGQVAPAVQSGVLPPLLVRVLLEQYPRDDRTSWWSVDSQYEEIGQFKEAVMCSPELYNSVIH